MKRHTTLALLGGLVVIALTLVPASGWPEQPPVHAAPIHPAVRSALASAPDQRTGFFVLLEEQADLEPALHLQNWSDKGRWVYKSLTDAAARSQGDLHRALTATGPRSLSQHVSAWQSFWIVNAIWVRGDSEAVAALARQPGVARILPEIRLDPPELVPLADGPQAPAGVEWNVRRINADDVWALGYRGQNMVVANVDTGVDYTHPALVRQYRGNRGHGTAGPFDHDYNWFDPLWGSPSPRALPSVGTGSAPNGHGTHVMGTEVGSDGGANEIGVAPAARWIASYGCCPDNQSLLAALQWHLAPTRLDGSQPNPDLRAHALQNSWGGPGGSLIFNQALAALKAAGVFVSFSAGNAGNRCGTLGSPGDNPATFNVGSSTQGDGIAYSSSRGPDPFSGQTGPDLIAPGSGVRSAVPTGLYAYASGTSMAGPHIAGAVALLWQARPDLIGRVDYTAELLRKTAQPIFAPGESCGGVDAGTQQPNNSAGWGRLDVLRAVRAAGFGASRGHLLVTVRDSDGQPLTGVALTLQRPDAELGQLNLHGLTDAQGRFEYLVAAGPATLTAQLFGYEPASTTVAIPFQVHLPALPSRGDRLTPAAQGGAGAHGLSTHSSLTLTPLPQVTLRGVVHEDGLPAKRLAATITLPGIPLQPVSTDCSGAFSLTLPAGSHRLSIEALGYEPQEVTVPAGGSITETFGLTPTWDYIARDSRTGGVVYQWIDATDGTRYRLGDDAWAAVNLPPGQSFSFYGRDYDSLFLGSNGFVTFDAPYARFHGMIPFEGPPNGVIHALGEDLNPGAGSDYGTGLDNGIYVLPVDGKLVLQYNEVEHWAYGDPETFQLILDPATDTIQVQYHQISWPDFTTVGVENGDGTRATVYSYANSAGIEAGLAVEFTPQFGQAGQVCRR